MRRWSFALGAVALVSTGAVWASITLTPGSHDFGQLVVGDSRSHDFRLTGTTPASSRGIPAVIVIGRDFQDFTVDVSGVPLTGVVPGSKALPQNLASSCLSHHWMTYGACTYAIVFRPRSPGPKTAQLIVDDNGETARATLAGEGLFGCRQYLVSCNYADLYVGKYSVTTDEAAPSGNRRGHWVTSVEVELLVSGGAKCSGTQNDWEEEWNGGKLAKRSTAVGSINGPGLFAIEFRKTRSGKLDYVLSFACPSPTVNTTEIDHISGTSSAGTIPSEPAVWGSGGLAADPQPAGQIASKWLSGTQKDPRAPDGSGSGVTGMTTMTWSFQRP